MSEDEKKVVVIAEVDAPESRVGALLGALSDNAEPLPRHPVHAPFPEPLPFTWFMARDGVRAGIADVMPAKDPRFRFIVRTLGGGQFPWRQENVMYVFDLLGTCLWQNPATLEDAPE